MENAMHPERRGFGFSVLYFLLVAIGGSVFFSPFFSLMPADDIPVGIWAAAWAFEYDLHFRRRQLLCIQDRWAHFLGLGAAIFSLLIWPFLLQKFPCFHLRLYRGAYMLGTFVTQIGLTYGISTASHRKELRKRLLGRWGEKIAEKFRRAKRSG